MMPSRDVERAPLDTGYSWVVLVASFLLNLLMNACSGGMGVMLVELMETFETGKSVILSIGGLQVSIGFLFSVINGWLIKRVGYRAVGGVASLAACLSFVLSSFAQDVTTLYITYGFMLGISSCVYFTISSIAVQQYFDKRKTLAQGTVMSGLSAGLFIWPPLTRFLIDRYGWRGALLIHGSIQLNGIVLTALIRQRPPVPQFIVTINEFEEVNMENDAVHDKNDVAKQQKIPKKKNAGVRCFRALFKSVILFPYFVLFILAIAMVQMGNVMPYTLTPARAASLGIDKDRGALLVSIAAGVSGICRVLCGYLGDRPWMNRLLLCVVAGLIGGALTAFTASLNTFVSLAITFGLIGIPSAAFMASFGTVVVDIVGARYLQQGVGLMSFAFGLAQLTTFLVTGSIQDLTGDPKYSFLLFGLMEAAGGIVFFVVYLIHRRRLSRQAQGTVSKGPQLNAPQTTTKGLAASLASNDLMKSTSSLQIC